MHTNSRHLPKISDSRDMPGLIKHQFQVTTYHKPTYCDCCSRLLWGLTRQGLQCTGKSHCLISTACDANIHKSCQSLVLVSCHGTKKKTAIAEQNADPKSMLKEIVDQTQKGEDDFKDLKQPLNLLTTTPKNFTRMVSKIKPLVDFQDEIIDVLSWTNTGKSMAYLLGYCLLCLYPTMIFLMPHLYVISIIVRNYCTPSNAKKQDGLPSQAQYIKNMAFIQNHMGVAVDLIDASKEHARFLDWSDERVTHNVLGKAIVSLVLIYTLVTFVPIKYLFLVAGICAFVAHTTWFKLVSTAIPRVLSRRLKQTFQQNIVPLIQSASGTRSGGKVTVLIWENQRWWAGLGWIPYLLRTERSAWSDETGTLSYSHINEFELPKTGSWEWVEREWNIDDTWNREGTDEQGWQYSDNAWQGSKNRCTIGSFTRRRCWKRSMKSSQPLESSQETKKVV